MDHERFFQGYQFHDYVAKMEAANRDGFLASYKAAELSPEKVSLLGALSKTVHAYVACEDWCGDCRINVPLLARMSEANPNLVVRIHGRDASKDLGVERIPTFVFYNESFEETVRWIERPAVVASLLLTDNSDQKRDARRKYNAGEFHSDTFDELLAMLLC